MCIGVIHDNGIFNKFVAISLRNSHVTADDQFINGLARIAAASEPGMNPAKLGKYKNVAEYLRYSKGTDSFTVTIQGRELRVIPVQPIRPDLK